MVISNPSEFVTYQWTDDKLQTLNESLEQWLTVNIHRRTNLPEDLWSPEPLVRAVAKVYKRNIIIVSPFSAKDSAAALDSDDIVICEFCNTKGEMCVINTSNMHELLRD